MAESTLLGMLAPGGSGSDTGVNPVPTGPANPGHTVENKHCWDERARCLAAGEPGCGSAFTRCVEGLSGSPGGPGGPGDTGGPSAPPHTLENEHCWNERGRCIEAGEPGCGSTFMRCIEAVDGPKPPLPPGPTPPSTCPSGQHLENGRCVPDTQGVRCGDKWCQPWENCVNGICIPDDDDVVICNGVRCGPYEKCLNGACVPIDETCPNGCSPGFHCENGDCVRDDLGDNGDDWPDDAPDDAEPMGLYNFPPNIQNYINGLLGKGESLATRGSVKPTSDIRYNENQQLKTTWQDLLSKGQGLTTEARQLRDYTPAQGLEELTNRIRQEAGGIETSYDDTAFTGPSAELMAMMDALGIKSEDLLGTDVDRGTYAPPDDLVALAQKLTGTAGELLDTPRTADKFEFTPESRQLSEGITGRGIEALTRELGFDRGTQERMFGKDFEGIRDREATTRDALIRSLSRGGYGGTATERGSMRDLTLNTENMITDLQRDLYLANEEQKKKDYLDYSGVARSSLESARDFEGTQEQLDQLRQEAQYGRGMTGVKTAGDLFTKRGEFEQATERINSMRQAEKIAQSLGMINEARGIANDRAALEAQVEGQSLAREGQNEAIRRGRISQLESLASTTAQIEQANERARMARREQQQAELLGNLEQARRMAESANQYESLAEQLRLQAEQQNFTQQLASRESERQDLGFASDALQTGLRSEELREAINAARRGESNQALQMLMQLLGTLVY